MYSEQRSVALNATGDKMCADYIQIYCKPERYRFQNFEHCTIFSTFTEKCTFSRYI